MRALIRRELHGIWHDPWQLALLSYIPLIGILCLWWMFSAGIPRMLPVAVVDHDQSQTSRMLVRQLQASSVISPRHYQDVLAAKSAMQQGQAYAMVVLPHNLNRDLLRADQPTIDIRYNSQYLLVGKLLSSQIQLSLADGLKHKALLKQLAAGVPKPQAQVNINLLSSQTTALYNSNSNYVVFLLPPILVALGQLLAMLVFANSLNRELRWSTMAEWPRLGVIKLLSCKLLVNMSLLLLQGYLVLAFLYQYLQLPLAGSLWQLMAAQVAMLTAVGLLVLVIFLLLQDSARVISFCTALFAPGFPFMGITFPTEDMPALAQYWRVLMPSSHYIDTHVGVVSYGQPWAVLAQQIAGYWGFLLLLPMAAGLILRLRKSSVSGPAAAGGIR
ncbi:ABC transporter permease [Shewanella sp. Scap07]|uniref:ABC transporter permease n=1 Tax=Shewanella sp. Scap07 TaxID=2589987 RepID=UPI0015B8736A|nr:ABC transporter permease [Shewanella sp. Scap07]QLE87066.1 ABC transporter permease [Shewanella sp. Scap07]